MATANGSSIDLFKVLDNQILILKYFRDRSIPSSGVGRMMNERVMAGLAFI